ncbi:hypothetical protein RND81_04G138900 [Saponaria officinalis]|uniref:OVATE domain-containing protein n=1 Tax=Saponaria officinalis TaxID=3572 RepID=A0AAW1LHF4_SAPOF
MKMKALFSFKDKVIEPCGKFLSSFKHKFHMPKRRSRPRGIRTRVVRFRKPFSLKSLTFPQCRPKSKIRIRSRPAISSRVQKTRHFRPKRRTKPVGKPVPKVRIAELLTVLFSLRKLPKEVDTDTSEQVNMADVTSVSVSEGGNGKEPFPSPTTPAYVRPSTDSKKDSSEDLEEVEDSCRSFESYLVEMIVEDGKLKDLMDVEELLYCWRNLKSPIFVDLVSRFYGEVCEDLFSPSEEDESHVTTVSE